MIGEAIHLTLYINSWSNLGMKAVAITGAWYIIIRIHYNWRRSLTRSSIEQGELEEGNHIRTSDALGQQGKSCSRKKCSHEPRELGTFWMASEEEPRAIKVHVLRVQGIVESLPRCRTKMIFLDQERSC
jgi:hypothetical protein